LVAVAQSDQIQSGTAIRASQDESVTRGSLEGFMFFSKSSHRILILAEQAQSGQSAAWGGENRNLKAARSEGFEDGIHINMCCTLTRTRPGQTVPNHDELCQQLLEAFAQLDAEAVTAGFVNSLVTRHIPARLTFASAVILQNFKRHEFRASAYFSSGCRYCGASEHANEHCSDGLQIGHTFISLETLTCDQITNPPSEEAVDCLKKLFSALRSLPKTAQLGELNQSLQGIVKSNKYERMYLLEILGYAGILCPKDQLHYSSGFVTYDEANIRQPIQHAKREWDYPVRFWTGKDGVNEAMIAHYFRDLL
jgi:hypothetical protein